MLLHHLLRYQKDIGLTDDQVGKLKALALDQDRAKIRAHADVMVAERELKALVWDEKTDLSAIQAKFKEQASLEAQARFLDVKGKRELLAVLTPEQRDKLKALRERMRESHGARASSRDFEPPARGETADGAPSTAETEPFAGHS
jgi:Spy/CpxP family protein refolding chaperone